MTNLFREALDICDRMGIRPYGMDNTDDGVILVHLWEAVPPSLAGRTGIVSLVTRDGAAHLHVAEGCCRFVVVLPIPDATPGDIYKVPGVVGMARAS